MCLCCVSVCVCICVLIWILTLVAVICDLWYEYSIYNLSSDNGSALISVMSIAASFSVSNSPIVTLITSLLDARNQSKTWGIILQIISSQQEQAKWNDFSSFSREYTFMAFLQNDIRCLICTPQFTLSKCDVPSGCVAFFDICFYLPLKLDRL